MLAGEPGVEVGEAAAIGAEREMRGVGGDGRGAGAAEGGLGGEVRREIGSEDFEKGDV